MSSKTVKFKNIRHDDITAVVSLLSTFKVRFSLFKINIWNTGESEKKVMNSI